MKPRMSHILSFIFALAMSVPAIQTISVSDADAAPGSTLSESRKPGRRVHKVKQAAQRPAKNSKKDDDEKKKRTTSSPQATGQPQRATTAPRPATTRQARPQGPARTTGRTRPAGSSARPSTTRPARPVTTSRHRSSTVRTTSRATRRSHSRTSVHHHYYDDHSTREVSTARRAEYDDSPSTIDGYFTLGLGMSGFAANQITDTALSGMDWNLGLGVKGTLFGGELGLHGGAYSLGSDPGQESQIDFTTVGVTLDLKLQPSFSFFEPYVLAGFGGYLLQDGELQETATGSAIRLGAGADFRFNDFSIGARYLFTAYALGNNASYYDLSAQTESIGINASFYF